MPEEKSSKDQKAIEKAAKLILGTDAMSRFTKTPIQIQNMDTQTKSLLEALAGVGIKAHIEGEDKPQPPQPPVGMYYNNPSNIEIQTYGSNPNYQDVARVIHHENVHALLEGAGYKYPILSPSFWDRLSTLSGNPVKQASDAFTLGLRAGSAQKEIPAYVSTYNPTELPNFSENERQKYLNTLMPTLQPNTANLLQRIVQSFNASQNPPF